MRACVLLLVAASAEFSRWWTQQMQIRCWQCQCCLDARDGIESQGRMLQSQTGGREQRSFTNDALLNKRDAPSETSEIRVHFAVTTCAHFTFRLASVALKRVSSKEPKIASHSCVGRYSVAELANQEAPCAHMSNACAEPVTAHLCHPRAHAVASYAIGPILLVIPVQPMEKIQDSSKDRALPPVAFDWRTRARWQKDATWQPARVWLEPDGGWSLTHRRRGNGEWDGERTLVPVCDRVRLVKPKQQTRACACLSLAGLCEWLARSLDDAHLRANERAAGGDVTHGQHSLHEHQSLRSRLPARRGLTANPVAISQFRACLLRCASDQQQRPSYAVSNALLLLRFPVILLLADSSTDAQGIDRYVNTILILPLQSVACFPNVSPLSALSLADNTTGIGQSNASHIHPHLPLHTVLLDCTKDALLALSLRSSKCRVSFAEHDARALVAHARTALDVAAAST